MSYFNFLSSLKDFFFSLLVEREEGREGNIDWCPPVLALTGNWTCNFWLWDDAPTNWVTPVRAMSIFKYKICFIFAFLFTVAYSLSYIGLNQISPSLPQCWLCGYPRTHFFLENIPGPIVRNVFKIPKHLMSVPPKALHSFIKTHHIISPMYHTNNPCAVTRGHWWRTQQNPFY